MANSYTMKTNTKTLIKALRTLANDIESRYIVANAAIAEGAQRLEELHEMNRKLLDALNDITEPLAYMKRTADEEGLRLSGMAYGLSQDPEYLKEIARKAITEAKKGRK